MSFYEKSRTPWSVKNNPKSYKKEITVNSNFYTENFNDEFERTINNGKVKDINAKKFSNGACRAGIIPFFIKNGIKWFIFGRDKNFGELTDFGGGFDYKLDHDSNGKKDLIFTAIREYKEEFYDSANIFKNCKTKLECYEVIKDCEIFFDDYYSKNALIFVEVECKWEKIQRNFYKSLNNDNNSEVDSIVIINQYQLKLILKNNYIQFYNKTKETLLSYYKMKNNLKRQFCNRNSNKITVQISPFNISFYNTIFNSNNYPLVFGVVKEKNLIYISNFKIKKICVVFNLKNNIDLIHLNKILSNNNFMKIIYQSKLIKSLNHINIKISNYKNLLEFDQGYFKRVLDDLMFLHKTPKYVISASLVFLYLSNIKTIKQRRRDALCYDFTNYNHALLLSCFNNICLNYCNFKKIDYTSNFISENKNIIEILIIYELISFFCNYIKTKMSKGQEIIYEKINNNNYRQILNNLSDLQNNNLISC